MTAPSGSPSGNSLVRRTESAWSKAFPLLTLLNLENLSLIGIYEKIALGGIRIAREVSLCFSRKYQRKTHEMAW